MSSTLSNPKPGSKQSKRSATRQAFYEKLAFAARIAYVRLRFLIVLLVAFLVVGRWDAIENRWDQVVHSWLGGASGAHAVSADTEYFCPMDPGVLSDWPADCPICNMALVRRKKGDATLLPEGIVARMQISPYRVQLAGVRTDAVEYRPLTRDIVLAGLLKASDTSEGEEENASDSANSLSFEADVQQRDLPFLSKHTDAELTADALPVEKPFAATVTLRTSHDASPRAHVVVHDRTGSLLPGMFASARVTIPIDELEPFRSMPADMPDLVPGEARTLHVCQNHPNTAQLQTGTCPLDKLALTARQLSANQRIRWWCPMHPEVTAHEEGHKCEKCKGMVLIPRIVSYRPAGHVLAVPESSVVNTGRGTLVYLERGPGMFDGVEVVLGARCDGHFPVISGLEQSERVVTNGAFLLDAETRLNPSLAASYFGAGSAPASTSGVSVAPSVSNESKEQREIREALSLLSPEERAAAETQKLCPVTEMPLGSMGKPETVMLNGRKVFLCCEGCRGEAESDPGSYLKKLDQVDRK